MNYALIVDGVVSNVIYLHPMNADDFPNAVNIDGFGVGIGDAYVDGVFWRDGVQIKSNAEIAAEEKADMVSALNNLGVYNDEQLV